LRNNFADTVVNRHSGRKYNVSTARKVPLKVWETAVIRSGLFSGFSTKNFLFVEETVGDEWPSLIADAHRRACEMATTQPEEVWQMSFDEIRQTRRRAAVHRRPHRKASG
jgi:hypothetical protein